MSDNLSIIDDVSTNLWQLIHQLSARHSLAPGVVPILVVELTLETLRRKAPAELDVYLDVLKDELPKGPLANFERLQEAREELGDIVELVVSG